MDSKNSKYKEENANAATSTLLLQPDTPDLPVNMEQPAKDTDWKGIFIVGVGAIIQAVQFSIFFSSLWPYLLTLSPGITENFLGYIIALYSLAQLAAAPTFGYWSNRIKQVRLPLCVGFTLMGIGNFIYLLLQLFPSNIAPFAMIVSRIISGLGSGNATLLRSYVAMASTPKDRSRAISCVSGGIALGTLLGPACQLLFVFLGEDGIPFLGHRLTIYNGPVLLGCLLNLTGFILVRTAFVERVLIDDRPKNKNSTQSLPSIDYGALGVCIVTRFTQIFLMTVIETIGSPYSMLLFSQTKIESVSWNSGSHAVAGAAGAIMYIIFIVKRITKFLRGPLPIVLIIVFFLSMYVATYSYPFNSPAEIMHNGTGTGCDADRFDWCEDLTATNIWLGLCGMFIIVLFAGILHLYVLMIGVAFSFLNVTMTTMYSKLIGQRRQGTLQGVYQMSGSVGRMIAPLLGSELFTLMGPRSVWVALMVDCVFAIIIWLIFYKRMIPEKRELQNPSRSQKTLNQDLYENSYHN